MIKQNCNPLDGCGQPNLFFRPFGFPDFPGDGEGGIFTPEYQTVIDYATLQGYTLPSPANQANQNALVQGMIDTGIWQDLFVFYNFSTDGDRNFAKINWKNPGTFQGVEGGAMTFTPSLGFTGDGATGFINTQWTPGWGVLTDSGFVASVVNSPADLAFPILFGHYNGGLLYNQFSPLRSGAGGLLSFHSTDINFESYGPNGFFQSYFSGNQIYLYRDAVQVLTQALAPVGEAPLPIYLFARNDSGVASVFSNNTAEMFAFGKSLIGKELLFRNGWNNYLTAGGIVANYKTPLISGPASVGSTLTVVNIGQWTNILTVAYQWFRDGAPIVGADNHNYILIGTDFGKTIACQITVTGPLGSRFVQSNQIGPVGI